MKALNSKVLMRMLILKLAIYSKVSLKGLHIKRSHNLPNIRLAYDRVSSGYSVALLFRATLMVRTSGCPVLIGRV